MLWKENPLEGGCLELQIGGQADTKDVCRQPLNRCAQVHTLRGANRADHHSAALNVIGQSQTIIASFLKMTGEISGVQQCAVAQSYLPQTAPISGFRDTLRGRFAGAIVNEHQVPMLGCKSNFTGPALQDNYVCCRLCCTGRKSV